MIRWLFLAFAVALVIGMAAIYYPTHVPDLQQERAANLISRAPEFNRYARLVRIEPLVHFKDSQDQMSAGTFTFVSVSSSHQQPITAKADFRYWDGAWHLNLFEYGCPSETVWGRASDGDGRPDDPKPDQLNFRRWRHTDAGHLHDKDTKSNRRRVGQKPT
jgi:hypothetical protein